MIKLLSGQNEYGDVIFAFPPTPSVIPTNVYIPIIFLVFNEGKSTCKICLLVVSDSKTVFLSLDAIPVCTNPNLAIVPIPLVLPCVLNAPIEVVTLSVNRLIILINLADVSAVR